MEEIVIIGGGIAGLVAANALIDFGYSPLLIDGGSYPSHKVCGEVISPESQPVLNKWNLGSNVTLNSMEIITASKSALLPIKLNARTCSRWKLDASLAERATSNDAIIRANTFVDNLINTKNKQETYELKLSNGEEVEAKNLIIGTGRLVSKLQHQTTAKKKYRGFKGHFSGIELHDTLQMYLVNDGYIGAAPIEDNKVNVAGIVNFQAHEDDILTIISQNPRLEKKLSQGNLEFSDWITVDAPEFGRRSLPNWPNTYFVGDAIGTLFPATGSGLSMGIISGYLAALYLKNKDPEGYRNLINEHFKKTFFWAKILHKIMMSEIVRNGGLNVVTHFPAFINMMHQKTRVKAFPIP